MEQYIRIYKLDGVAELQYKYTSISTNPVSSSDDDNVRCCLAVPPISLFKAPLDLKCKFNYKVVLGRALTVTYTVTSKMPFVDKVCISLDHRQTLSCLVAGELVSTVELMPGIEYTFKYNVIPLQLGM